MTYDSLRMVEKARWMALLMAIDQIDDYCQKRNKDFDEEIFLKPIPIKHYIEEKHLSIKAALKLEQQQKDNKAIIYNIGNKLVDQVSSVHHL